MTGQIGVAFVAKLGLYGFRAFEGGIAEFSRILERCQIEGVSVTGQIGVAFVAKLGLYGFRAFEGGIAEFSRILERCQIEGVRMG